MDRPTAAGGGHVLVVDGDRLCREFVELLLGSAGYSVRLAGTRAEVDAALRVERPDLVLCDLHLPDDPSSVIERFAAADTAGVPLIVCSGAVRELEAAMRRLDGTRAQALLKPFDIDELLVCVRRALRGPPPDTPDARAD